MNLRIRCKSTQLVPPLLKFLFCQLKDAINLNSNKMYHFAFTSLEFSFFGRTVCYENLQCFVEFLNNIRQTESRLNLIHNVYSSNMII